MRRLILLSCLLVYATGVHAQTENWVSTWGTATALALDPALDFVRPPPVSEASRASPPPQAASPIPPKPYTMPTRGIPKHIQEAVQSPNRTPELKEMDGWNRPAEILAVLEELRKDFLAQDT